MFKRLVYPVVLVLLGVVLGAALQPFSYLQTFAQPGCQTFKETGKTVCGRFLDYWQKNGGLAQQGFPLSNEFMEKNDLDGKTYTVQYFERAVFEYHPEQRNPKFQVLLSRLGAFQFQRKYPNGEPGGSQPTPSAEWKMTIETAKGRIVLKLYTDPSANVTRTIANFTEKANRGYFDGLTFHRVEDWIVQGGDPTGAGTGGGNMPAEYNQIPFTAGSLGVARGGDPAINNDSQFFIVKADSLYLNGQYTNFGYVVEGMDVLNRIAVRDKIIKMRVEGASVFQEPDRVTVQNILVGFKDAAGFQGNAPAKAKTRTQEQARTLAYDLLNRVKGGADFDGLVKEFSDDSFPGVYSMANTRINPVGDEVKREAIVQAFGDLSFRLQVGEVGITDYDKQTSPYGYHIIKRLK